MYWRLTSPRTEKELFVYAPSQARTREDSSSTKDPPTDNALVAFTRTKTGGFLRLMAVCKPARQTALKWWRREVQRFMIPEPGEKYEVAIKHLLVEVLGDFIKQVETKHLKGKRYVSALRGLFLKFTLTSRCYGDPKFCLGAPSSFITKSTTEVTPASLPSRRL